MPCLLRPCAVIVSLGVVLLAGQQLDTVSETLVGRLQVAGRKTVAVVDFTDLQGNATQLGRYLAEELSVMLASSSKHFTVIDRTHLKAILQEHKLGASGLIDSQTARRLGKLAGVDTLIAGTLTPLGDSVRLSVKAIDAETAAMVAAKTADIPKTKAIEELLTRSVGGMGENSQADVRNAGRTSIQRLQGAGVTLELESCQRVGTCQLFATAEQDTRISFVGGFRSPVRAWDNSGNEYEAQTVRVGNQSGHAELVAGIRTSITIGFDFSTSTASGSGGRTERARQPTETISLAAIEVRFAGVDNRLATLRFRNISLR